MHFSVTGAWWHIVVVVCDLVYVDNALSRVRSNLTAVMVVYSLVLIETRFNVDERIYKSTTFCLLASERTSVLGYNLQIQTHFIFRSI